MPNICMRSLKADPVNVGAQKVILEMVGLTGKGCSGAAFCVLWFHTRSPVILQGNWTGLSRQSKGGRKINCEGVKGGNHYHQELNPLACTELHPHRCLGLPMSLLPTICGSLFVFVIILV